MDVSEKKKELIQYMEKHPEGNFEIQAERAFKKHQSVAEKFAEADRIKVECTPYKKSSFFRDYGSINILLKINNKWKNYITVEFYLSSPSDARTIYKNKIENGKTIDSFPLSRSDEQIALKFYGIMGVLNGSKSPKEPDKSL